ncbi:MAG: tetratricopeptide repeat protein, partial [Pseudomonadales bacterium]
MTIERCRSVWLAGVILVLGGCVTPWDSAVRVDYSEELLSGVALFGEEVGSDEAPDADILGLTDDMVSFVEDTLGKQRKAAARFRKLFSALVRGGYFNSGYQANTTNTAAETFLDKSGNCLSYTSMFIALAREAGLDARFQIVDVPPTWDADSGYLIRYTHINVLLKGVLFNRVYGDDISVDFNDVLPDPDYARYVISDDEASALYYANRSVGLFRSGSHREAFALLKKAIEIDPDNPDLWINLGAFYAKRWDYEHAIQAYQMTLQIEPQNRGAMSGLGRSYEYIGETE